MALAWQQFGAGQKFAVGLLSLCSIDILLTHESCAPSIGLHKKAAYQCT